METDRKPSCILMTADTVGGVWTYALELCAALDIDIVLASMGELPSRHRRAQVARLPNVMLFESEFRLEWMENPWDDLRRAGDWLLELESKWLPDIVHLNNFAHGDLGWKAPVLMAGHSCVLSWWEAVHGLDAPEQWDNYRERVRRGLRAADLVVAPSHAMGAALNRHYGPLGRTAVIPNGRNALPFQPAVKEPTILAVGRLWDEGKNAGALLRIASKLPWSIQLAGPTPAALDETHLGPKAEADIAQLMSRAAIYALPARYEPFGLSILEAALSGCALVLGDIPSLRENWSEAALFVDPFDDKDLLAAISVLIENADERHRLAAAARERALTFSPAAMAERYLSQYRMLMASEPVHTCV